MHYLTNCLRIGDVTVFGDDGQQAIEISIAAEIRFRFGRGVAIVGQDYLRRAVLKERDHHGAVNIGLIGLVTRHAWTTATPPCWKGSTTRITTVRC